MKRLKLSIARSFCTGLAVVFVIGSATVTSAGESSAIEHGADLFQQYCASCHGRGGYGDGPVGRSLMVEPADLTRISARNGGEFPTRRVSELIDGRTIVPAHGPREMPVWGYLLEGEAGNATASVVEYLRSIQR